MSDAPLSFAPGGTSVTLPQAVALNAAVGTLPLRIHREVFYLRFRTSGPHARVTIGDSPSLRVEFSTLDYDALGAGPHGPAASVTSKSGFVIVEMDVPRRLRRISLGSGLFASGTSAVASKTRSAGAVPAGSQPRRAIAGGTSPGSGSAQSVDAGATLFSGAQRGVGLHRVDGESIADEASLSVTTGVSMSQVFSAAHFAIKATSSPDIAVADVGQVQVRGMPTVPRIGLAMANLGEPDTPPPAFFWQQPGEADGVTMPLPVVADVGAQIREPLQRLLDDLLSGKVLAGTANPAVDGFIDVALVIESDVPCSLKVIDANVPYSLITETFQLSADPATPKHVLRFDGGRTQVHEVTFEVPRGAVIQSAEFSVASNFVNSEFAAAGIAADNAALVTATGAYVGGGHRIAQVVIPSAAVSVRSVMLALLAVTPKADIGVELRADHHGVPTGQVLASGTVITAGAGEKTWHRIDFASSQVLDAQPYWLVVRAATGAAVWLASSTGGVELADVEDSTAAVGATLQVVTAGTVLHSFSSSVPGSLDPASSGLAFALTVAGANAIPATEPVNGAATFDCAASISGFLDSQPPGNQVVPLAVLVSTTARGVLTAYPPRIQFELVI